MYEVIQKNEYSSLTRRFQSVDSWDMVARDTFSSTQRARSLLHYSFGRSCFLCADIWRWPWLIFTISDWLSPSDVFREHAHSDAGRFTGLEFDWFVSSSRPIRVHREAASRPFSNTIQWTHTKAQRLTRMRNVDLVLKVLISKNELLQSYNVAKQVNNQK